MKRLRGRHWILAVLPVVLAGLSFAAWSMPHTRLAIRVTVLLPTVFVDVPLPLDLLGEDITVERTSFPYAGTSAQANVYRPNDAGRHPALLAVPGAAPRGLDDPRIVRLAEFGARAGFVIMVLELPDLMSGVVRPGEVEGVVRAVLELQRDPSVDRDRVGVLGFSVGGSLALVAAADQRIKDEIVLVGSFGGYYDLGDVIVAATGRAFDVDGAIEPWQPARHVVRVLRLSLIDTLEDAADRVALTAALEGTADPAVLSRDARRVYDLLNVEDAGEARQLLEDSPARVASMIEELSPRSSLGEVRAEVFLIATEDDPLIPFVESRKLRDALDREGVRVHHEELSIMRHLNPSLGTDPAVIVADSATLLRTTYILLTRLL